MKDKIITLHQNSKKCQCHLILANGIFICQLNIFIYFINNFTKGFLADGWYKFIVMEHMIFFVVVFEWQFYYVSHDSEVFGSDACFFVPVGGVAELSDASEHWGVFDAVDGV